MDLYIQKLWGVWDIKAVYRSFVLGPGRKVARFARNGNRAVSISGVQHAPRNNPQVYLLDAQFVALQEW